MPAIAKCVSPCAIGFHIEHKPMPSTQGVGSPYQRRISRTLVGSSVDKASRCYTLDDASRDRAYSEPRAVTCTPHQYIQDSTPLRQARIPVSLGPRLDRSCHGGAGGCIITIDHDSSTIQGPRGKRRLEMKLIYDTPHS